MKCSLTMVPKLTIAIIMTVSVLVQPGCSRDVEVSGSPAATESISQRLDFEAAYIIPLANAVDLFVSQAASEPALVDRQTEFVDLNDDGRPDALVLLEGPELCSPNGCAIVVFSYDAASASYRAITVIAPVLTPLLVASSVTNGWRDLVVVDPERYGDGIASTPYVVLPFDGSSYPSSPRGGQRLDGQTRPEGELLF